MSKLDEILLEYERRVLERYLGEEKKAKAKIKDLFLEMVGETSKKTKEDSQRVSLAHDLYSGGVNATSFRAGWNLGVASMEISLKKIIEEQDNGT